MPKISNKKFVPVNRSEAKEHIFRTVKHDHEGDATISKEKTKSITASPRNFEKGLSDPFFASKLDSMGNSKISYSKMMYTNTRTQDKVPIHDYQKI